MAAGIGHGGQDRLTGGQSGGGLIEINPWWGRQSSPDVGQEPQHLPRQPDEPGLAGESGGVSS